MHVRPLDNVMKSQIAFELLGEDVKQESRPSKTKVPLVDVKTTALVAK